MIAAAILAAGSSSRLGMPKQNLLFRGQTLLQIVINAARESGCEPVAVVTGANAASIKVPQADMVLHNPDWQEGMSSSIRLAIQHLEYLDAVTGVILLVCDQPFVSAGLLAQLINEQSKTGKKIVACRYNETIGVPALFDRSLFPQLLSVSGHQGAKKIIAQHQQQLGVVAFECGGTDIDTLPDYEKLLKNNN